MIAASTSRQTNAGGLSLRTLWSNDGHPVRGHGVGHQRLDVMGHGEAV